MNYLSLTSLVTALNVFSTERKGVVLLIGGVQFLCAALFANARKVNVSEFQVKNWAILRLRLFKKTNINYYDDDDSYTRYFVSTSNQWNQQMIAIPAKF